MALQLERKRTTFPVQEMSHLLYGTPEYYQRFLQIQNILDAEPSVQFDVNFHNKSRQEQLLDATAQYVRLPQLVDFSNSDNFILGVLFTQKLLYSSVHQIMVIPGFEVCATDEQRDYWLPKLKDYSAIGCYAQTELAHGSDVQNLQTTATYVFETKDFIIHTPNVGATKYWPGDLGLVAKFALLYCQLIVKGKSYGTHPLWVPIRDANHDPFPGVEVGDIGPKLGYSTKDNGFLSFNNYRVSGDALLQKYIKVQESGKVIKIGNPKVGYASMMLTRKTLCDTYPRYIGMALTIAVRFSLTRKQFMDDDKKEIVIMDYQLQQEKLIPLIAEYYAIIFGGLRVKAIVDENFNNVMKKSDFTQMGFTHAILSGCKANYTQFVTHASEWCRLSCGGHGFAQYSGLPAIYKETAPNVILEGENTILNLQLARYMLKQLRNSLDDQKNVSAYFEFIRLQPDTAQLGDNILNLDQLLLLHSWNVNVLLQYAAQRLTSQQNISTKEAWDKKAGISLVRAAQSYIPYFNFRVFKDKIDLIRDQSIIVVLTQLAQLYGVCMLLQNMHGLLLRNLITPAQISQLKQGRENLFSAIRPNVLALVEANGFSDGTLRTLLGCEDGEIYERLYDYVSNKNTINKPDPFITRAREHVKKMKDYAPKL